jgi:hypothetical protein
MTKRPEEIDLFIAQGERDAKKYSDSFDRTVRKLFSFVILFPCAATMTRWRSIRKTLDISLSL